MHPSGSVLWSRFSQEIRGDDQVSKGKRMSTLPKTELFSRGRALAMGVIAALALTALGVLPGASAWAEEDAVPGAPAVEETVAQDVTEPDPAEQEPAAEESGSAEESGPAESPGLDEDLSARVPGEAPSEGEVLTQQAPALSAAAAVARTISGKVTFPAGASLAQKKAFSVYANEPGKEGKLYQHGVAGFTYNPNGSGTLDWAISNLKATKYYIWVDLRDANGYYSAPLALGLKAWTNAPGGDNAAIDLSGGNATAQILDANIGSISVGMVSPYTNAGNYKLMLVDAAGSAKNITNSVYSGDSSSSYPLRNHDFNAKPGNYTLRADLPNGLKIYYDGTPFGTQKASAAKTITVELMKRIRLGNFDLREFTDVPKSHKFYTDINWLAQKGITTGVNQPNGTLKFLPKGEVSREAMVAFLYRIESPKNYKAPAKSPFTDVKPGHKFYTQIMWAYENKVTTGIKQPGGKLKFAPGDRITREAMAAFMYRQYKDQLPKTSGSRTFTDVPNNHKFAKEVKWMAANGITTGVKQTGGKVAFQPKATTTREATAAFLHRAETK
jgi:hypothetical protein